MALSQASTTASLNESTILADITITMVKLLEMPTEKKIDGFKKTVDFYFYKGIPCARMWPQLHITERAPSVRAQWPVFSYAAKEWNNLSPLIQGAYKTMAANSHLTGRDFFMRSYISGIDYSQTGRAGNPNANSKKRFALESLDLVLDGDKVIITTTTDVPATLFLHFCPTVAPRHRTVETRRGLSFRGDMDWCVPTRKVRRQKEPEDTKEQTFEITVPEIAEFAAVYVTATIEAYVAVAVSCIVFLVQWFIDLLEAIVDFFESLF